MRIRKWDATGATVTITLTKAPDDYGKERLNRAIRAFSRALAETSIAPGDTVECVDAWDTFNALTVGQVYDILDARDGMVFVKGNTGHIGGWWPSHFKHVEAAEHS